MQKPISSRGHGTIVEQTVNGKRVGVVQPDFELLTFDAVFDQSVRDAKLQLEAREKQKPQFTEEQLRYRKLAGLPDSPDTSDASIVKVAPTKLTETQRRQREVAGLLEYMPPGQWSERYDETPDQKGKVIDKLPKTHDVRAELRDALRKQGKAVEPLFPESERSWMGYSDSTKLMVRIRFERDSDGNVTTVQLAESRDAMIDRVLKEIRDRQRQLAGING